MINIVGQKIKVKDNLRIFYLDNNDVIVMTEKEFDEEIYQNENFIIESVNNKHYVAVFDKKDDYEPLEFKPDIVAFQLVD